MIMLRAGLQSMMQGLKEQRRTLLKNKNEERHEERHCPGAKWRIMLEV